MKPLGRPCHARRNFFVLVERRDVGSWAASSRPPSASATRVAGFAAGGTRSPRSGSASRATGEALLQAAGPDATATRRRRGSRSLSLVRSRRMRTTQVPTVGPPIGAVSGITRCWLAIRRRSRAGRQDRSPEHAASATDGRVSSSLTPGTGLAVLARDRRVSIRRRDPGSDAGTARGVSPSAGLEARHGQGRHARVSSRCCGCSRQRRLDSLRQRQQSRTPCAAIGFDAVKAWCCAAATTGHPARSPAVSHLPQRVAWPRPPPRSVGSLGRSDDETHPAARGVSPSRRLRSADSRSCPNLVRDKVARHCAQEGLD